MSYQYKANFTTAFSLNASTTATNGVEFTSTAISVPYSVISAVLLATFTRAAGSASLTVDFYVQVSPDNGTTWYTYTSLAVTTGETVVSGTTVNYAFPINLAGVTHIRLWKVVNNDTANNLTAVNAGIAF